MLAKEEIGLALSIVKKKKRTDIPEIKEIEKEIERVRYKGRYRSVFRSTLFTLVVVSAIAVLVATLWMPVLRVYGRSMSPTLDNGNIMISFKEGRFKTGDIVAFYYNNKILVKRAIAQSGDWVDIDKDGNVSVNNKSLNEPYIKTKSLGNSNIKYPYQVPDGKIFVLGDNRDVSIDSRNTAVGCISEEQIVGKLVFRIWPLKVSGFIR